MVAKDFSRVVKMVKFEFTYSKLSKGPFFDKRVSRKMSNLKSQKGPVLPIPTSMLYFLCTSKSSCENKHE